MDGSGPIDSTSLAPVLFDVQRGAPVRGQELAALAGAVPAAGAEDAGAGVLVVLVVPEEAEVDEGEADDDVEEDAPLDEERASVR